MIDLKKLEQIRERARKLDERKPGTFIEVDNPYITQQLTQDILWLCRQINQNVPKKMTRKELKKMMPVSMSQFTGFLKKAMERAK